MSASRFKRFLQDINDGRQISGKSINNFPFKEDRCRLLTKNDRIKANSSGILYWMDRDQRIQDNWALLYAQKLARKYKVPLFVCFLLRNSDDRYPTQRQYSFLTKNLQQVKAKSESLNIKFYILNASPNSLSKIVANHNIGAVVCDFSPLQFSIANKNHLIADLTSICDDVPVITVDAHNIVPVWVASDKQEYMARTIRPKITANLADFLTDYPQVCPHEYDGELRLKDEWRSLEEAQRHYEPKYDVAEVDWATPGEEEALRVLYTFITTKLSRYGIKSNDPSEDCTSNLSPWLHFGHISAQRVAFEVQKHRATLGKQVETFLEELIVRKELAENYCYFNSDYTDINKVPTWARVTLAAHSGDRRPITYTRAQLEQAHTQDDIWNAAQKQLVRDGKMHSYMRMYWCKKILEWTESPEEAIQVAVWLNDVYSLDGTDPNGYTGIMWSLCGVHDQGFKERPIFGKIRYMVDYSVKRKFDMDKYCARFD